MNESKNPHRIDPVPPEKFYSTGEVMAHTGLSRQTLHNYKRLGLIHPAKWSVAGHCYYDASVFERLRKIKIYQRHRSLMEIRDAFDAEDRGENIDVAMGGTTEPGDFAGDDAAGDGAGELGAESAAIDGPDASTGSTSTANLDAIIDPMPVAPPSETLRPRSSKSTAMNNAGEKNKKDAEKSSDLARGLITGEETPPRLYRIGDIMRLTGYSRQTLHNYTVQGLIQARERTPAGHRLYGEEVFRMLRLIEIFKRHRRFSEVQKLIDEWRELGHTRPGSGLLTEDEENAAADLAEESED